MTSSTNTSTRPEDMDGNRTAIGRAGANGIVDLTRLGGVLSAVIILLRATVGFQSAHLSISFARSVTSSDTAHQVGGFGAPPNVSRRDTYAISSSVEIV